MEDFTNFYDFLKGKEIARRPRNPPTLTQLRLTEDAVWEKIADQLIRKEKPTLGKALQDLPSNGIWWQNHLYTYCDSPNNNFGGTYNMKGGNVYGKGKYGKAGNYYGNKGKNRKGNIYTAPGNPYSNPNHPHGDAIWAGRATHTMPTNANPNGQEICRRQTLFGNCWGMCGRNHSTCPNKKTDGQFCYGQHAAQNCPNGHTP